MACLKRNFPKAKKCCELYAKGVKRSDIARVVGVTNDLVTKWLEEYYEDLIGETYQSFTSKRVEKFGRLYSIYQDIYKQGIYTKQEMCDALAKQYMETYGVKNFVVSSCDLEYLLAKYNLHHQWMKTYDGQVTLCNVSREFRKEISDISYKLKDAGLINKASVRAASVYLISLGRLMLKDIIEEEYNNG